jgi:hypothetical protein
MSLARITDDPSLKQRYQNMAIDFAQSAENEPDPDANSSDSPRRDSGGSSPQT